MNTTINNLICKKFNIFIQPDYKCEYFWFNTNLPTTTKPNGCWNCNFGGK